MERQLEALRLLYNAMLEQRRLAHRGHGVSLSRFDQERQLSDARTLPEYMGVYSHAVQDVARRVDLAFQGFFRRVKAGEKPGYPRFKTRGRYDSLSYKQPGNGCVKIEDNRVSFSKLAKDVRFFQHRPIQGTIQTVTAKRRAGKWYVLFSCKDVPPDPKLKAGEGEVGVDVGLTTFATLSNGEGVPNPRYAKKAQARLRAAQRHLSRRKLCSNRRRKAKGVVARQYEHVRRQRRDHHFKVARDLVQRYGFIAVEDLQIQDMMQGPRGLARSIADAGWGQFMDILSDKAEEAGSTVVRVNPRGTTQECSGCGVVVPKTLRDRVHHCVACGLVESRDINAAKNILQRARTGPSRRAYDGRPVEARSPAP